MAQWLLRSNADNLIITSLANNKMYNVQWVALRSDPTLCVCVCRYYTVCFLFTYGAG